jgi:hypothetical protein
LPVCKYEALPNLNTIHFIIITGIFRKYGYNYIAGKTRNHFNLIDDLVL